MQYCGLSAQQRFAAPGVTFVDESEADLHSALGGPLITLEGFRTWLEEHCGRGVLVIPTAMPPSAPSGVWLRTDAADYLYYEERTSPFHQAHVVASLAARLLIGDVAAEGMSRQLVPDLQLQAGKPFHGVEVSNAIGRSESESFAFEILRRRGFFPSALQAHILLRRLQPLRRVLPASAVDVQAGAVRRLYHSVVAVRDRRTGHRTRCVRRLQAEKSFRLPNVDDTLDRSPSGSADAYPRS